MKDEKAVNADKMLPDLVMLILRMSHQLKQKHPESDLPAKAEGYLRRHNVMPQVESAVIRYAAENARRIPIEPRLHPKELPESIVKPIYEQVQPEEMKAGDKVFCEFNGKSGTLVSHDEGDPPWLWTLDDGEVWGWEDQHVFRQLPPERNPDVLERALRNAVTVEVEKTHRGLPKDAIEFTINRFMALYVDGAAKQLEAESESK